MALVRKVPLSIFLSLALLASGCARGGWVATHPQVAARAQADPASFLLAARADCAGVRGLVANYTVRASRGIGRRSFDVSVWVESPSRIDIRGYSPVGQVEALLVASAVEIGVWFADQADVLYRGAVNGPGGDERFGRALGVPLLAADTVALFLGCGVDSEAEPATVVWDADRRRVRVELLRGEGRTLAWLHPVTLRFETIEHTNTGGRVIAAVESWVPRPVGSGGAVPSRIHLDVEDRFGLDLRLIGEAELNPRFGPADFAVPDMGETVTMALEELAREGGLLR